MQLVVQKFTTDRSKWNLDYNQVGQRDRRRRRCSPGRTRWARIYTTSTHWRRRPVSRDTYRACLPLHACMHR